MCVALVDERFARILRGSADWLRETVSFGDPVHGRHEKGGWSQARYQRSIREEIEPTWRHVGRTLLDLLRVAPYERLLIACTEPLWPRVVEKLHPEVRKRLREPRLSLDGASWGGAEVWEAAVEVLGRSSARTRSELLEELRARHARAATACGDRPGRGLAGAGRTARGVAALRRGVAGRRGVACPRGDWLGCRGERCPLDGEPLEQRQDIVEDAVQAAVSQSAEVLALRERPELGPRGARSRPRCASERAAAAA